MLARWARLATAALRAFGPEWVLFRASYAVQLRAGLMRRRAPAFAWDDAPLSGWLRDAALADAAAYHAHRAERAPRFFFAPGDRAAFAPLLAAFDTSGGPQPEADAVAGGRWSYFSGRTAQAGFPPDWHANPFTLERAPADRHWSTLGDFAFGDIKVIWEPSRFAPAYALVRAYWRGGDERYPELFWRLVEDWRAHNPPGLGPNWKCGQETSFRVMAWCFGLYGFQDSPASTPARVAALAQMIAASGRRIAQNLAYAVSQRNNHGVSEGLGLFTVGTLFPELRDAERWRRAGAEVLESLARELIYDDGSFAQHSVNYHRLVLHDYLWVVRLAELNGAPLSEALRDRVGRAARFLYQIQDEISGGVPRYGANDGSLILPLANGGPDDFRPVVQHAHAALFGERRFAPGPWDEEALWMLGRDALARPFSPAPRRALRADAGGYYTLRGSTGFVVTRCARFRHRPGHADQLHVDLWWKGHNIALDAGTYGYNAREPWGAAFDGTSCHNTVSADGRDQMERVSRFLWFPWATGRVLDAATRGDSAYWEGEHDGYARLARPVRHRRAIARLGDDAWLIADALACVAPRAYRLHWLLPDYPYEWDAGARTLALRTPAGPYHVSVGACGAAGVASLVRADPTGARGWRAPRYGVREPALSLALEAHAPEVRFWTVFAAAPCRVAAAGPVLDISLAAWSGRAVVGESPLVRLASAPATAATVSAGAGNR